MGSKFLFKSVFCNISQLVLIKAKEKRLFRFDFLTICYKTNFQLNLKPFLLFLSYAERYILVARHNLLYPFNYGFFFQASS